MLIKLCDFHDIWVDPTNIDRLTITQGDGSCIHVYFKDSFKSGGTPSLTLDYACYSDALRAVAAIARKLNETASLPQFVMASGMKATPVDVVGCTASGPLSPFGQDLLNHWFQRATQAEFRLARCKFTAEGGTPPPLAPGMTEGPEVEAVFSLRCKWEASSYALDELRKVSSPVVQTESGAHKVFAEGVGA